MNHTTEQSELIKSFGIKVEEIVIYQYKQYKYENLVDAINYAIVDHKVTPAKSRIKSME